MRCNSWLVVAFWFWCHFPCRFLWLLTTRCMRYSIMLVPTWMPLRKSFVLGMLRLSESQRTSSSPIVLGQLWTFWRDSLLRPHPRLWWRFFFFHILLHNPDEFESSCYFLMIRFLWLLEERLMKSTSLQEVWSPLKLLPRISVLETLLPSVLRPTRISPAALGLLQTIWGLLWIPGEHRAPEWSRFVFQYIYSNCSDFRLFQASLTIGGTPYEISYPDNLPLDAVAQEFCIRNAAVFGITANEQLPNCIGPVADYLFNAANPKQQKQPQMVTVWRILAAFTVLSFQSNKDCLHFRSHLQLERQNMKFHSLQEQRPKSSLSSFVFRMPLLSASPLIRSFLDALDQW